MGRWLRDPVIWVGATICVLAHAYVFFAGRYLPYIDWSNHIGLISIFAHGGDTGALAYAERSLLPTPYLLFYLSTAAFAQLVSVEVAAKLSLLVTTALLVFGAASLADACGRSPRLSLIAPLSMFGVSLGYGFGSFVFATPFLLFTLAATERLLIRIREEESTRREVVALAVAFGLTYLAHALVFLLTACLVGLRVGTFLLPRPRRFLRTLGAFSLASLPTALMAVPVVIGLLLHPWTESGTKVRPENAMTFQTFAERLTALPGNLLNRGAGDHALTMKLVLACFIFFSLLSLVRSREKRPGLGLETHALALTLLFLFGPFSLEWPHAIWMVSPRFGTLAAVLVFLLPRVRLNGKVGAVLAMLPLVTIVHNAQLNAQQVRTFSGWADQFTPVRALIPKGARVLALTVAPPGDLTRQHQSLGSLYFYVLADGAAYTAFLFDTALHPVRLRHDVERPRQPFWRSPGSFDPRTHGVDYDYLILRGPGLVERTKKAGLHELVANVNGWSVFRTKIPPPRPSGS